MVWADILSFAVFTGSAFVALCAMTRVARGWPLQILGLAALVAGDVLTELWWLSAPLPLDRWLAVQFSLTWTVLAVLVFALSRDGLGRRLFLSVTYGIYAACYASVFHLFVYRNVFGLSPGAVLAAGSVGLVLVAALNLAFVLWILPWLPHDSRNFRWRDPCLAAGVLFAAMFAAGLWPVSVVSAPLHACVPFALVSAVSWIAFPIICRSMRDRQRNVDVEHGLELMMAEVKVRRAAIDLARRLRHDQRHHRAQIAEYMLLGQHEKVFEYLRELDEEAQEAPTDKLVWCENETVNAVLSGAARRASAKGVGFVAEVHVGPTVALPDVELVAVLANLIENGVDATAKGGEVRVVLRQREFGIGITVANPVPAGFALSDRGLPCAEPGVGMESIRRVVGRHDGTWTYELADGILKCQVILMVGKADEEIPPGGPRSRAAEVEVDYENCPCGR